MNYRYTLLIIGLSLLFSCTQERVPDNIDLDLELEALIATAAKKADPNSDGMKFYILPDGSDLSEIPQDPLNPLTEAKVELGKMLFFETGLATNAKNASGMGTYSCGSCHVPEAGFKAGSRQGIADGGEGYGVQGESRRRSAEYIMADLDVQSARPLSLVNVAYVKNTTWNGRFGSGGANLETEAYWKDSDGTSGNARGFEAIETQNFEGLETHRMHITQDLIETLGYKELFDASFPELTEDEKYSNHGGSLAMSAYIRTIISNEAPFQKWLKEERSALNIDEKLGAKLFFGKANCSSCHYQPNLGSGEFHALGVKDINDGAFFNTGQAELNDRNMGRGAFTGLQEDMYQFKVPQMYNTADSPHYFHGSSLLTLEEVIEYKNMAVSENENVSDLSIKFIPLNLSEEEKNQLLLFVKNGLNDPNLLRYKPSSVLSGQCFPNNDPLSKQDLGCE